MFSVVGTMQFFPFSTLVIFLFVALHVQSTNTHTAEEIVNHFLNRNAPESAHTNNWAVLVCASRYWFNYRVRRTGLLSAYFMAQLRMQHMANALGMCASLE